MSRAPDDAPDELTAYLDGELDESAASEVEARLRRDPAMRREAEALKRTWGLLDFLPQPEPSATFTSRTLDKMAVLKPAVSTTLAPVQTVVIVVPRSAWPMRVALAAAALLLFLIGYASSGPFLSRRPPRLSQQEAEEQMAKDLRVIDQLPLYQFGDDIDFLMGLDNPDLFGE